MQLALVFPGQGAQAVGMGADLASEYPEARSVFERADDTLGFSLSALCFEGPEERLRETWNAQPALVVTELATLTALEAELGRRLPFQMTAGHSVGEFAALVAAGAVPFEDALLAVRRRGELMHEASQLRSGSMIAVLGLPDEQVEAACREVGTDVVVGNFNCPGQVVVSGEVSQVAAVVERCRELGARRVVTLAVGGAFHSPLMSGAADAFLSTVEELRIVDPEVPVVGNVRGERLETSEAIRAELREQLRMPVRWTHSVRTVADAGITSFLELGPGQVLRGLIGRTVPNAHVHTAGNSTSVRQAAVWVREQLFK